jgi:hypothetical protein
MYDVGIAGFTLLAGVAGFGVIVGLGNGFGAFFGQINADPFYKSFGRP